MVTVISHGYAKDAEIEKQKFPTHGLIGSIFILTNVTKKEYVRDVESGKPEIDITGVNGQKRETRDRRNASAAMR